MKAALDFMCPKWEFLSNMFCFFFEWHVFKGGYLSYYRYLWYIEFLAIEPSCWEIGFAILFTYIQFGRQHFPYLKIWHMIWMAIFTSKIYHNHLFLWDTYVLYDIWYIPYPIKVIFCNKSANWTQDHQTQQMIHTFLLFINNFAHFQNLGTTTQLWNFL